MLKYITNPVKCVKAANNGTDKNRHFKFFAFMNVRDAAWNLCAIRENHDVTKTSP
jgi:hypothetical protein